MTNHLKIGTNIAVPLQFVRLWTNGVEISQLIDGLEELLDPESEKRQILSDRPTCFCGWVSQVDDGRGQETSQWRHIRNHQDMDDVGQGYFICWSHRIAFPTKREYNDH